MADVQDLRDRITEALGAVIDPEVGLDIVSLGLVYGVEVEAGRARIRLTMTSPACPLGEHIRADAAAKVRAVEGVHDVDVELVWDPPWSPDRMTSEAKRALGWSE